MAPPVTVLIPHYRAERFLAQAAASMLAQEGVDLELWIVDDCSPGTAWLEAIASIAGDPRVRVYRTDRNVGAYRIKNAIIPAMSSPYVAFQDADDYSEPSRLRRQLREIERSGASLVGCGLAYVGEDGRRLYARRMPRHCNLWLSLGKWRVLHSPTSLFRRSLFDSLGGFDGTARIAVDDDFTLRAASISRVRNVPAVLYAYRQHPHSLTAAPDTGFGSAVRAEYARRIRAQHRARRMIRDRAALMRSLAVPPNDMAFEITRLSLDSYRRRASNKNDERRLLRLIEDVD